MLSTCLCTGDGTVCWLPLGVTVSLGGLVQWSSRRPQVYNIVCVRGDCSPNLTPIAVHKTGVMSARFDWHWWMLVKGYVDPSCTQPPVLSTGTVPVAASTRGLGFCQAWSSWYSLLHCRTWSVHTVSLMAAICVDILTPYAMLKGREDACVWGVTPVWNACRGHFSPHADILSAGLPEHSAHVNPNVQKAIGPTSATVCPRMAVHGPTAADVGSIAFAH